MATRKKKLQSIYLEPLQAKLLDELAAETRIAKAVLLREAVDDLLSKHHKGAITATYMRIRAALRAARPLLVKYRGVLRLKREGVIPLQEFDRAIDRIDEARASLNDL